MILPNVRNIKEDAAFALARGRDPKKLIYAFSGLTLAVALVLTLADSWLAGLIEGTGGLGNMGMRSILSTARSVIPIVQMVILMGLEFGYLSAVLRISRGQYADHTDLKVGFRRLAPILRLTLVQALRFTALGIIVFYLSIQLFLMTSWAEPLVDLLLPLMEASGDPANLTAMLDEAALAQAYRAMAPMMVMFVVLYALLAVPMAYRMRLSAYLLVDDPKGQAMRAIRQSTQMMRGNKFRFFKLDLSFWWYYLLTALASVVAYTDTLLPMLGIRLPFNDTVGFYLFYLLYLVLLFVIYVQFRNRVDVAYAKAYDSLVEKSADNGVVLGNIFDL